LTIRISATRLSSGARAMRVERRAPRPDRARSANGQRAIRELVAATRSASQGDLAEPLRDRGFAVTQATVSRDIAELGLVKCPGDRQCTLTSEIALARAGPDCRRTCPRHIGWGADGSRRTPSDDPCAGSRRYPVQSAGAGSSCCSSARPARQRPRPGHRRLHWTNRREPWPATTPARPVRDDALERGWRVRSISVARVTIRRAPSGGAFGRRSSREEGGARVFGRARHIGRRRLAARAVRCEVVTLTVDVGGGALREGVERRAMSAGARAPTSWMRGERFVTDFVWPHLQANALYQGAYPLATALARPLIAQLLVEVAAREGADAVAHGCTGKGNDQVRFDVRSTPSTPARGRRADARRMGLTRDQEIDYATERGIEIPITKASPYSIDATCGAARSRRACSRIRGHAARRRLRVDRRPAAGAGPGRAHDRVRGRHPGRVDGERLRRSTGRPRARAGGRHGVGRIDHVEDRLVGIKSREIYEAPAATSCIAAHRALEGSRCPRTRCASTGLVADELAQLTYDGSGSARCRATCARYVASVAARGVGRGPDALDHGMRVVVGRRSPLSLYDKSLATYDEGDAFDHAAAVGFIEIFGLPLRTEARATARSGRHHGAAWTWTDPLLKDRRRT
jgi:argininosuccinate synthase